MTVSITFLTTGPLNVRVRVEDLLKAFWKIGGFTPTDWNDKTTIRVNKILCYGLISKYDSTWTPAIAFAIFDPVIGEEYKRVAAIGDVDDPPRLGWQMPKIVAGKVFHWDGVVGSSAPVAGFTTSQTGLELTVYAYCVFTIGKRDIVDWQDVDEVTSSSSRSSHFSEIDPDEVLREVHELSDIWRQ